MNEQKTTLTADRVQAEYEKGVQYNTGIGLYENVKQCENFVEGKQWEGLKSKNLRPITMNVLDPIVHYKVAQIVSNDVDQEVEPFLPDEQAEYAAKILEQSIDRVVERTKLKSKHHMVLRDACVDGDAALYFYFDASKQSGFGGVQGEICAEQVMNTNILFGNPSNSNVQEQPYLIIVRRRPVSEIRKDAKRLGCKEWKTIEGESDGLYKGDDEQNNSDSLGNELVRFWKSEDGRVHYCRSCGRVMIEQDVATEMTLYPVAYLSWKPRKNCYHGVMEIKPLINTQIEINKQWTALALMLRNNAMPKLVYNRNKFPKGWDPDATSIGVTGDVKDALTGVAGSMPIPTEATGITSTMTDALKSVAGANDAALGNVKNPENSSAIVAVQTANAAPLALTKIAYYQFVEDYERVLIDMMHAYYGMRQVKITDEATDPETGDTQEQTRVEMFDFGSLSVEALDLNIHIGEASYWSRILQISTLNNLQTAGVMPNMVEFLSRMPEGSVKDQEGLVEAAKRVQQQASMQQALQQGGLMNG